MESEPPRGIGYPEGQQHPGQLSLPIVLPPTYLLPPSARVRYILGSASSLHWDWLREGAVSRTHAFRVFGKEFSLHSKSYFDFLISGDEGRS